MAVKKVQEQNATTDNFSETMAMYWLSKHGYDVVKVEYTGINLLAYHRKKKERLGITVLFCLLPAKKKSVSFVVPKRKDIFDACATFACMPYVALIVDLVEKSKKIRFYLFPWSEAKNTHTKNGERVWVMDKKQINQYEENEKIKKVVITYDADRWNR